VVEEGELKVRLVDENPLERRHLGDGSLKK
jgi:hypothetical protein